MPLFVFAVRVLIGVVLVFGRACLKHAESLCMVSKSAEYFHCILRRYIYIAECFLHTDYIQRVL